MGKYLELKAIHQKEVNGFPLIFAFSNEQFKKGLEKLGLTENDVDKIVSIGGGGFVRKADVSALNEMMKRHGKENKEAMKDDQYVYDMFRCELANHEYCITYDYEETLDCLGLTIADVKKDQRLLKILKQARYDYLKFDCE